MKSTHWPHTRDPYEIFQLVLNDPRIPRSEIARYFKTNPKTADIWWETAIKNRIIIPPVFRRRSFFNFREYFYFVKTGDPHLLYENLKESQDITYYSVQTGFADFQIIAETPLSLDLDVVLTGERSNYYVSTPPHCTFEEAIMRIQKKLKNTETLERYPSPLIYQKKTYGPWDDLDDVIYRELANDLRKPFAQIIKSTNVHSKKIIQWFRNRERFGQTITMFFPQGESSYQLSLFSIKTKNDWLLIDLFSELPTSTVFYRLNKRLMMSIYLPFYPSPTGRLIVRKTLSDLRKKELVTDYTNSIVEYYYRP